MVKDLSPLRVTADEVDEEVGEEGEEDENNELSHNLILNENSETLKISKFDVTHVTGLLLQYPHQFPPNEYQYHAR